MNSRQMKAIIIFIGIPLLMALLWALARYYGLVENGYEGPETPSSNVRMIIQKPDHSRAKPSKTIDINGMGR